MLIICFIYLKLIVYYIFVLSIFLLKIFNLFTLIYLINTVKTNLRQKINLSTFLILSLLLVFMNYKVVLIIRFLILIFFIIKINHLSKDIYLISLVKILIYALEFIRALYSTFYLPPRKINS